MNQYFTQALHNKKFLECIESNFSDTFFDWKVTVIFYISLHLLKALALKRNKKIGDTHHDIYNSLDPMRSRQPVMQIPPDMWRRYKRIQGYSNKLRYEGITDLEVMDYVMKKDYEETVVLYIAFSAYMKSEGFDLN